MQFFVKLFAPGDMQRALGVGEIGTDQILIDLDQHRRIRIEAVEHDGGNAILPELANRFEPMLPGAQLIGEATSWPDGDRMQQTAGLDRFGDLIDDLRPQPAQAIRRDGDVAERDHPHLYGCAGWLRHHTRSRDSRHRSNSASSSGKCSAAHVVTRS